MNTRRVAQGLGWFSIALGLSEIAFAKPMAKALGIPSAGLLRAFGVREIVAGIGVLTQEKKGPWIWARIGGDVLDSAVLGLAMFGPKRRNAALATLAVAPVIALDVLCGKRLGVSS